MDDMPTRPVPDSASMVEELIRFYDEFLEFQAYCALLCDAMSSIALTQLELDDATKRGVDMFSGYLKRRVEELAFVIKQIQEKSCADK